MTVSRAFVCYARSNSFERRGNMSGWRGTRPYKEPRSLPYVKDGAWHWWDLTHSGFAEAHTYNDSYAAEAGPDPGLYYLKKLTVWLWTIMIAIADPDTKPLPPPVIEVTDSGRSPPLVP